MPLPLEIREELGRKRDAEGRVAERDKLRDLLFTALQCLGCSAAGIFCLAWSVHTTDAGYGRAAFFAGLGIGNGGILFTLLAAYRRGEQRGDW